MKTVLIAVAGFVLLLSAANVCAQYGFMNGNKLKQQLDRPESDPLYAIAIGFISGVHDTLSGTYICNTKGATLEQFAHMIRNYLAQHPERWHEPASLLVANVLTPNFPCPK